MTEEKNSLRNILKSEIIYEGRIVSLRVDRVKFPSGVEKTREVVLHGSCVAMLAEDEESGVFLVRQYRHAVDEEVYEIPAGITEDGESPEECAARELQEEIGMKPGRLEKICEFYSSPGFTTEKITLFHATELTASKLPGDDDEYIKVRRFSLSELARSIAEGGVKDGKTIAACCWLIARKASK